LTKRGRTRSKPAIVVIGDINVDMLGRVNAWPKPGQDCLAPRLEMHCGGVGANSAIALARWGVDVRLAGCVGRDSFGDFVLDHLARGGVNARWVGRTSEAMTGFFYINITPDGTVTVVEGNGRTDAQRGQLRLVSFTNAQALLKEGFNLYTAGEAGAPQADTKSTVRQGFIEKSNVNSVAEMSRMMEVSRAYTQIATLMQQQTELQKTAIQQLADVPA